MVSTKEIQATCDDIVREFAPQQVILFGSYAYGTPTEASDVDLFVVMEAQQQAREIQKRIPRRFHLDLHVRCPKDIAYRVAHNDWFLREVFEKGDVLYDTATLPPLELAENVLVPIWEEKGVMNPLTMEKIQKAEDNWAILTLALQASRTLRAPICFHAQQCVEKYLKAWLQEANLRVPRTHNLNALLRLIGPTHPEWRAWRTDFKKFKTHAVEVRYETFATAADVEHAVRICTEVRTAIRTVLQLPNDAQVEKSLFRQRTVRSLMSIEE